jgi:predicted kinase
MKKPKVNKATSVQILHTAQIAPLLIHDRDRPQVVLMVGTPGCGKSTIAQSFEMLDGGFVLVSRDQVRERLLGSAADQSEPELVEAAFKNEFENNLRQGLSVVVDNTNVFREQRASVIELARSLGVVEFNLLVMLTPLEQCLARNAARERVVPPSVICEMHTALHRREWPRRSEGFITLVRPSSEPNLPNSYRLSGHLAKLYRQRVN